MCSQSWRVFDQCAVIATVSTRHNIGIFASVWMSRPQGDLKTAARNFKDGIWVRLTKNEHIMYYMRSPLTGHLFLLLEGRLTQRGQWGLVPAAQVHLCGRHEGQIFDVTARLGFLFAGEHHVPFRHGAHGNYFLWGFLTAQLSLIWRARLKLCFLRAEFGTFATRFLDFGISKARFPVCVKNIITEFMVTLEAFSLQSFINVN